MNPFLIMLIGLLAGALVGSPLFFAGRCPRNHYRGAVSLHSDVSSSLENASRDLEAAGQGDRLDEARAKNAWARHHTILGSLVELDGAKDKSAARSLHSLLHSALKLEKEAAEVREQAGTMTPAKREKNWDMIQGVLREVSASTEPAGEYLSARWTWPALSKADTTRLSNELTKLRAQLEKAREQHTDILAKRDNSDESLRQAEKLLAEAKSIAEGTRALSKPAQFAFQPTLDMEGGKTIFAPVTDRDRAEGVLGQAEGIVERTSIDYLAYETDVALQIDFPQVIDRSTPATAAYLAAQSKAVAYLDTAKIIATSEAAEQALKLANEAAVAFANAERAARNGGWSAYSNEQRRDLKDAKIYLDQLLSGSLSELASSKMVKQIIAKLASVIPVNRHSFDALVDDKRIAAGALRMAINA